MRSHGPASGWANLAGRRFGAFTLALLCGIAVPLSPLAAEQFVTGDILPASWSAVGVTYVAGIGLVSRSHTILICMLLLASVVAFVYGVDMKGAYDHIRLAAGPAPPAGSVHGVKWMISLASGLYVGERVVRHLVGDKPFLES